MATNTLPEKKTKPETKRRKKREILKQLKLVLKLKENNFIKK